MRARAALFSILLVSGCTSSSGSSGSGSVTPASTGPQVNMGAGTSLVPADSTVNDKTTAQAKTRLGLGAIDRSFTLTTPGQTSVNFSTTALLPRAHGHVTLRAALGSGTTSAASDFAASGLSPGANNVVDAGKWIETHGDGFARLTFTGAVAGSTTLVIESEDDLGNKSHAVVNLGIGAPSIVNPDTSPVTSGAVLSSTPIFSSSSPVFGLPSIAGNGDKVSVMFYDTGSGTSSVVPGVSRVQKRLQYNTTSKAVTLGASAAVGDDGCNWTDTATAGLFNVIVIAQAGSDGVKLDLSFDRGATFAQTLALAPGRSTRLARAVMAPDYTTGIVFWDSAASQLAPGAPGIGGGTSFQQRLVLLEGKPDSFDVNGSPTSFAFGPAQVLVTFDKNEGEEPLISDVQYAPSGDTFVAYGCVFLGSPITTEIGCLVRPRGTTTFTKTIVDTYTGAVPFDPSLAVTETGGTTQVYIGYETWNGVHLRMSQDRARTFPTEVVFGTKAAYAPRLFARQGVVDCVFIDVDASSASPGNGLFLFHANADLSQKTVSEIVAPKAATFQGNPGVEAVAWFGFDATVLNGKLYAAVHTRIGNSFVLNGFMGAPGGGPAPLATAAAPAPPLAPGMTGPVPPFDATASNKLFMLEID